MIIRETLACVKLCFRNAFDKIEIANAMGSKTGSLKINIAMTLEKSNDHNEPIKNCNFNAHFPRIAAKNTKHNTPGQLERKRQIMGSLRLF